MAVVTNVDMARNLDESKTTIRNMKWVFAISIPSHINSVEHHEMFTPFLITSETFMKMMSVLHNSKEANVYKNKARHNKEKV